MNKWENLVLVATKGLERNAFDTKKMPVPVSGLDTKETPAAALLASAGSYRIIRKSSSRLMGASSKKKPFPASPESKRMISGGASGYFYKALTLKARSILREAMVVMKAYSFLVPPEHIPMLISTCLELNIEQELVLEVSGHRGEWLLAQHPDWKSLFFPPEKHTDCKTPAERIAMFRSVRTNDLVHSRSLFSILIKKAPAREVTDLVKLLEINLDTEDEALLTPLLSHRSKEVKIHTSKTLSQIPGNELTDRMIERLTPLLRLKKRVVRAKLEVSLPARCSASMKADGVDLVSYAASGLGKKAGYFCQMLAAVPPTHWTATFTLTAKTLVDLGLKTEWSKPLIMGWALATLFHKDPIWAKAIVEVLCKEKELHDVIKSRHRRELMKLIPNHEMEKIFNDALGTNKIFNKDHLDLAMIADRRRTLPPATGKKFIDKMDKTLRNPAARIDQSFLNAMKQLSFLGLTLPVTLYPEAVSRFQTFSHPPVFKKNLEEMMVNLEFRYKLMKLISQ